MEKNFPNSLVHCVEKHDLDISYYVPAEDSEAQAEWLEKLLRIYSTSFFVRKDNNHIPVFVSFEEYADGGRQLSFTYIHPADQTDRSTFLSFKKDQDGWDTSAWDEYRSYQFDYLCKVFDRLFHA